jgi:hypothetical protein
MITNQPIGQYQPPVLEGNPNMVVTNNQLDLGLGEGRIELGLFPHFFVCNQCGYVGDTKIDGSCNCLDCCGYFCCSGLYILYTIITLKDYITFMEVRHSCPKCGKYLGTYKTI